MLTEYIVTVGSWLEDGQIQVKRTIHILENGVRIAERLPHRHVVAPGDDVSGEDSRVRVVAQALHTPEVIAAYEAAKAARRLFGQ